MKTPAGKTTAPLLRIPTRGLRALKRFKAWRPAASGHGAQSAPRLPRAGPRRVPRLPLLAAATSALLAALLAPLSLMSLAAVVVAYRVRDPAEAIRASLLWRTIFHSRSQKIAPSSAGPAEVLWLLLVA